MYVNSCTFLCRSRLNAVRHCLDTTKCMDELILQNKNKLMPESQVKIWQKNYLCNITKKIKPSLHYLLLVLRLLAHLFPIILF